MLGKFQNFPEKVHYYTSIIVPFSKRKIQFTLLEVFKKLNNQSFRLEEITPPSIHQCVALFDAGLAESDLFNYLDNEEIARAQKKMQTSLFQTMDFLWIARYYIKGNGKRKPLKFDYFFIRFNFNKRQVDITIYHEKGPRHLSPQDVTEFIAKKLIKKCQENF